MSTSITCERAQSLMTTLFRAEELDRKDSVDIERLIIRLLCGEPVSQEEIDGFIKKYENYYTKDAEGNRVEYMRGG